jgi:hypothetical protein
MNRKPLAVEAVLSTLLDKAYYGADCNVVSVERTSGAAVVEATDRRSGNPVQTLEFQWSAEVLTVPVPGGAHSLEVDLYDSFAPLMVSAAVSELIWEQE